VPSPGLSTRFGGLTPRDITSGYPDRRRKITCRRLGAGYHAKRGRAKCGQTFENATKSWWGRHLSATGDVLIARISIAVNRRSSTTVDGRQECLPHQIVLRCPQFRARQKRLVMPRRCAGG
jgi:hypothetical protein